MFIVPWMLTLTAAGDGGWGMGGAWNCKGKVGMKYAVLLYLRGCPPMFVKRKVGVRADEK